MVKESKAKMEDAILGASITATRTVGDVDNLEVVLHETSVRDTHLQRCIAVLTGWVNTVIEPSRMLVQDFFDDLYDAKILIKLIELKTGVKLQSSLSAVTYKGILQNVKTLTNFIHDELGIPVSEYWNAEAVAARHVHAILFLVKDLAIHFQMTDPLPSHVTLVCIFKMKKEEGHIERKVMRFNFIEESPIVAANVQMIEGGSEDEEELVGDVFDKLMVASKEKVDQVRHLLLTFCNKHLAVHTGLSETVTGFRDEWSDGVRFIQLLGILGNFALARNEYYLNAQSHVEKSHNMKVAIAVMNQNGVACGGLRKQAMVAGEEGQNMRAAFRIYRQFKDVPLP